MKQSTTQWAREAIDNIQFNLIKRAKEGTLSGSDQQMMVAMMADIRKELESQIGINEAIQELYDNFGNIQKELSIPISSEGAARIERTASASKRNLNELEKVEHIVNALQLDAQSIIPLLEQLQQKQNEMRQSFQKAVDIDFQLYGKISDLTERALEAYHFEITPDRQVVMAAISAEEKEAPAAASGKEPYRQGDTIQLKIPSTTQEERKRIENQLFQAGARYYKGTIPAEKSSTGKEVNYKSWYVKYKEGMKLSAFSPYIKEKQQQKPSMMKQLNRNKKEIGEGKERQKEKRDKEKPSGIGR